MPPLFLADEMLAKLVRFMRVMGLPVRHLEGKSDSSILAIAKIGNFTLLTSDEELALRCKKRKIPSLYLPQESVERQLSLIIRSFGIRLPKFSSGTLCPACGGKLLKVRKAHLIGKIYPAVLERRRLFWSCGKCRHIYWSGTHYARLKKAYRKILELSR